MGLHFENQIIIVIESDDSRIVHKHRETPVVLPQPFPDLFRGPLDAAVEKGIDFLPLAAFVLIDNPGIEDLMFAVFGPRLREALKFGVGHFPAQACLLPLFQN